MVRNHPRHSRKSSVCNKSWPGNARSAAIFPTPFEIGILLMYVK
jgi:hypothetical protein